MFQNTLRAQDIVDRHILINKIKDVIEIIVRACEDRASRYNSKVVDPELCLSVRKTDFGLRVTRGSGYVFSSLTVTPDLNRVSLDRQQSVREMAGGQDTFYLVDDSDEVVIRKGQSPQSQIVDPISLADTMCLWTIQVQDLSK